MGSCQSNNTRINGINYPTKYETMLNIGLNTSKQINPIYKQLLNWSLLEIRQLYINYRLQYIESKVKTVYLLKTQFSGLLQNFSNQNAGYLFEHLTRTQQFTEIINFFEFVCILTINGHMNYRDKLTFLYLVFDFDMSDNLNLDELMAIFLCVIQGYCKLTNQLIPSYQKIEQYVKLKLLQNDQNNDAYLSLREMLEWLKYSNECLEFLLQFEPETQIQNDFQLLLPFKKIPSIDCRLLIQQIKSSFSSSYRQMKIIGLDLKSRQSIRFSIAQLDRQTQSKIKQFKELQKKQKNKLGDIELDIKNKTLRRFNTITESNGLMGNEISKEQWDDYFDRKNKDKELNCQLDKMIQQRQQNIYINQRYSMGQQDSKWGSIRSGMQVKMGGLGRTHLIGQVVNSIKQGQNNQSQNKYRWQQQYDKINSVGKGDDQMDYDVVRTNSKVVFKKHQRTNTNISNSVSNSNQWQMRTSQVQRTDGTEKQIYNTNDSNQSRVGKIDGQNKYFMKISKYDETEQSEDEFKHRRQYSMKQRDSSFRQFKTDTDRGLSLDQNSRINYISNSSQNLGTEVLGQLMMRKKKSKNLNNTVSQGGKTISQSMNKNVSTLKTSKILIMDGKSMTKDQAYKLKNYFDTISKDKSQIQREEFNKSFQDKPFVCNQSQSLFFFLDKQKKGFVSFDDMMQCFFPTIKGNQKKTLRKWLAVMDYQKNRGNMGYEKYEQTDQNIVKKKVLPYYCLSRVAELFDRIDKDNKGYISLKDFSEHMKGGLSMKEIEKTFNQANEQNDGRLRIDEFAKMIIPSDYVIRDMEQLYRQNEHKKQYL